MFLSKTNQVLQAAGRALQRIMSWFSWTVRGQQTRKTCAYWKDFFFLAQLKGIFSFSTVAQSSSLCGIPINLKRQISNRIISIKNMEKRLVGLGKLPRMLSEKNVWDCLEYAHGRFSIWGRGIPLLFDAIMPIVGISGYEPLKRLMDSWFLNFSNLNS